MSEPGRVSALVPEPERAQAQASARAGVACPLLPQAASATTIIEASNSDLFILYEPFMVVR